MQESIAERGVFKAQMRPVFKIFTETKCQLRSSFYPCAICARRVFVVFCDSRSVDDLVFLSESTAQLQLTKIDELQSESFAAELKTNMNKLKVMIRKHAECAIFSIGT